MRNSYGSLVEEWKVDRIVARAKRKGFREGEIEDVQQDIIQAVADFKYDTGKSNGATESTALTALIDNQLTHLQRGQTRQRRHEEMYRQLHGVRDNRVLVERCEPDHVRRCAMTSDVREGIARLDPVEQEICAGIMLNEPRTQIAKRLGISRYEVDRSIAAIRDLFEILELDEWLCE